jgi:pseudouridine-5'-phosphate glycosidase
MIAPVVDGPALRVAPPVAEALRAGRPVVALESTLITHGFPRPTNRRVAAACEEEVRAAGAVPATIAVSSGQLVVGLDPGELDELAAYEGPMKVSRSTLAAGLARGAWASTTVAATMIAAHAAGIRVFATGGVGGVHRGALGDGTRQPATFDISADLQELARTPVVVVCAGPKAILDVRLTLEYLETLGVPVVTLGGAELPGFYSRRSGIRSPLTAGDVGELARLVGLHLELGLGSGVLVCVPIPPQHEIPHEEIERAIEGASEEAAARGIQGWEVTPWLLRRVADVTGGRAVEANLALVRNNAATAARLAGALGARRRG